MRYIARFIIVLMVAWSATAVLWAQTNLAAEINGETRVSLALLLTVMALIMTVFGHWMATARAIAALQQCVTDHQQVPHLTQADIEAKASFYASKELCHERHGDIDRRLDRIERSIEELNGLIRQLVKQKL